MSTHDLVPDVDKTCVGLENERKLEFSPSSITTGCAALTPIELVQPMIKISSFTTEYYHVVVSN
jgi:hypothetical protein